MLALQQYNGEVLSLDQTPQRIVSLVPSVTETLIEWGVSPIAKTQFCIYPKDCVQNIPSIKGTKNPDIEKIIDMSPDLIIANKEENRLEDIELLQKTCKVWVTYPEDIESTLSYLKDLAKLCSKTEKINEDIKAVEDYFKNLKKETSDKVACFIWKKPWMVAAGETYISSLIESYSDNAFSHLQRYPKIELEDLKKNKVSHVFLLTEPFYFNDTHKQEFKDYFNKNQLDISVSILNGENFTWPGPRAIEAVEEMKGALRFKN